MGDPVKEEMGMIYVVDGLGKLSRGFEGKEVLNFVHAPQAQAGFPGLASAHKSRVGLYLAGTGGGSVTSEVVQEADCRDLAAGMCGGRGSGPAEMGIMCVIGGVGGAATVCVVTSTAQRSLDCRGGGNGEVLRGWVAGWWP